MIMTNTWDLWPQWTSDSAFRTPNFTFNCSTTDFSGKTTDDSVIFLKDRKMLDIYKDLCSNHDIRNIFELGYFQGGMPFFLSDMARPEKIIAIDWYPATLPMQALIESAGLSERLELIGPVDQADTVRLRSICDEKFASTPLDLIIDDCSHYYPQTKAAFQALFGYLRVGGHYVIEDWGWTHWQGIWQTQESHFHGMPSLTNLIFELVMALGSDEACIAEIRIPTDACIIVTRGPALPHKQHLDLEAITRLAGRKGAFISDQS